MSDQVWLAVISATPAIIAAVSSLVNGREQRRVRRELAETNGKISDMAGVGRKKRPKPPNLADGLEEDPDWYKPPLF